MTAVQRTETTTTAPEAPPPVDQATEGVSGASILGDLLRAFGAQESLDGFAHAVLDIVVRGLRLEAALLLAREGEVLRVAAAAGLGADVGALAPVALDAHSWPAAGTGLVPVPPEAIPRLLPAVPVRWRSLHGLPLWHRDALRGVLILASASDRNPGLVETELLRAVGEALGPELLKRQEDAALRAGVRAREEALAIVAHDLRNPLHAIAVGVSTLLPASASPPCAARWSGSSAARSAWSGCSRTSSTSTPSRAGTSR